MAHEPLPAKVILWLDLIRPNSGNSFATVSRFIEANPDWPNPTGLERQAEAALPPEFPAAFLRDWFARHAPVSAIGVTRYAEALAEVHEEARADELVRRFWVETNFASTDDEASFLFRYRDRLRLPDHQARLDRLLWEHQSPAARRLLPLVPPDHQALALARLGLAEDHPGAEALVRAVPEALASDPGLAFERLHWLRRKGDDAGAIALLDAAPARLTRPALWWTERAILARRLLARQDPRQAYRLAAGHGLKEGQPLAEAEFLTGWLALRFLGQPAEAFDHFQRMLAAVSSPMSRARGAYWSARALEALGDSEKARSWYEAAARFPTMFYGQLAAASLGQSDPLVLPPDPEVSADQARAFERQELVRVVRLLHEIDPKDPGDHLGPFLRRLAKNAQDADGALLLARLAGEVGRPDVAIAVSKQAFQAGVATLAVPGYPAPGLPSAAGIEPALALAIIRQESTFTGTTISSAGARGLMQLMPGTAQQMAGKLGLTYTEARLISDPDYNVRLGSGYLGRLIEGYDGSYLLAIAAYNAGTTRVRDWLATFGDPRPGRGADPLDWMESIPISETRNYVQRVLEALEVYRLRLGQPNPAGALKHDLAR